MLAFKESGFKIAFFFFLNQHVILHMRNREKALKI